MAIDPPLSRFSLHFGDEVAGLDAMKQVMDFQRQTLQQMSEISAQSYQQIMTVFERISSEREQAFARTLQLMAEFERLGLVDLAPVSPILGLSEPGDDRVPVPNRER